MRERGVPVFLGTDAAFGPWPGTESWPGFQEMARAIEVLVRWAQFDPMEAIRMATQEPARSLRLEEIGTIEAGKRADCILVAGDPLQDARALRAVEWVFRDGRPVAHRGTIILPHAQEH
jgi:imidazolonepropionase-like amidohydrolase